MAEDETTRDLAPDDEPTGDLSDSEKLNLILHRLTALGQRKDTRPIWERALAEIAETRQEMRERFDKLNYKLDAFNKRLGNVETDLVAVEGRIERLEGERTQ